MTASRLRGNGKPQMSSDSAAASPDTEAFSYKGYRYFWVAAVATSFATQIMSVSVAWQVYDLTRNPLYLGLVGLSQFAPALLLVLVTGLVSDRFSRRMVIAVCLGIEFVCALGFLAFSGAGVHQVWPIFAILTTLGVARAFLSPANQSLAPNLAPPQALASAITLNSMSWQFANIVGPMAGGLLYGVSPVVAYSLAAGVIVVAIAMVLLIPKPPKRTGAQATSTETLLAGFRYIWRERIVLGAISLDMFAVLLGGAVALLPVYARDILDTGPLGLGLLRSAPGVGAIVLALIMTRFPVRDHAGAILFGFVAAFGLFTTLFGFSTSVWFAVPALFMVGATDMVSVVIRETLMQLWTPDELRGRVSAVNGVFLGASNELGEFRAGVVAAWLGAVAAVTIGGMGTMAVAAIWSQLFPELRRARSLDRPMARPADAA